MTPVIIILSCVILIYVIWIFTIRNEEAALMHGFWTGDPQFMRDADLRAMVLYVDENSLYSTTRSGYLLAINDEGVILNHPIKMHLSRMPCGRPWLRRSVRYSVEIDWLTDDIPDCFPSIQTLDYYPLCGKLVFSTSTAVTAVLYKDAAMSDIKSEGPDEHKLTEDGADSIGNDD